MASKKLTKAEARHQAQIGRQRARGRRLTEAQVYRNTIGRNLANAILNSHKQYREAKQATSPT